MVATAGDEERSHGGALSDDLPTAGDSGIPALSGSERALFEALAAIRQDLANMYLGVLDVVARKSNPDYLALAAHGLRELIEKLPRFLELPIEAKKPPGLRARANELAAAWERWGTQAVDDGQLTKHGQKLLTATERFCSGVLAELPTRREQAATALNGLDLHPVKLPPAITSLHVEQWLEIERFFIDVAHHRETCTDDEFLQYQGALERFLLERLKPTTFEDFSDIDDLLAGEA